jgi:hypothetical protein
LKYVTTPYYNNCFILQIEDPLLSTLRIEVPTTEVQVPTTEVLLPTTEVQLPTTEEDVLADELRRKMNLKTNPTNQNPEVNLEASGSSLEGTSCGTRKKSTQNK